MTDEKLYKYLDDCFYDKEKFAKLMEEQPSAAYFTFAVYLLEYAERFDDEEERKELAFQLFEEAARLGLPEAMGNMGYCYSHGIGTERDYFKAERWFRKAAKLGDVESMKDLGDAYEYGHGVNKDLKKAFVWYQEAANKGNERAMLALGEKYRDGKGVDKDYKKAWNWYIKCKSEDCKWRASLYMAEMLYKGLLEEERPNQAKELYEIAFEGCSEAAENNDTQAMYLLGNFYFNGNELLEIDVNPSKAVEWYEQAAEKGNGYAMNLLGICYDHGLGVGKDITKACWWYEQATEEENDYAKYNLANHYMLGDGIDPDFAKGVALYQQLADSGIPKALTTLGTCYRCGLGVDKDERKGVQYYRKAGDKGESTAFGNLGQCYLNGIGLNKNIDKAIGCFQEGVKLDDPFCIVNLAECYIEGKGVEQKYHEAVRLLKQVCESEAEEREFPNTDKITLFYGGIYIEDPLHDINNYTYAKAYYLLAHLYYSGNGVKEDPNEAIRLLNVAENLGHKDATTFRDKIISEADHSEIADTVDSYMEIRYFLHGRKGPLARMGKYAIILHHADGTESEVFFHQERSKFMYLLLLITTKYKTHISTKFFYLKRNELIELARQLAVDENSYGKWIDEFIYINGVFNNDGYSQGATGIKDSLKNKKNELTPEEIKTYMRKYIPKGPDGSFSFLELNPEQIEIPSELNWFINSGLPTIDQQLKTRIPFNNRN